MTELQQKQLAFLEETITFYNLSNRCVAESGICAYYLDGKEGCAIGRKILDKELCKKLDSYDGVTGLTNYEIFVQLPNELKELGHAFLTNIQHLHDYQDNWTDQGLSELGRLQIEEIKRHFQLI